MTDLVPGLVASLTTVLGQRSVQHGPARVPKVSMVGIDGRSGSGKSTAAAGLAAALRSRGEHVAVVAMDDLYAGWDGLAAALPVLCDGVIAPLLAGEPAAYQRYDWDVGALGERVSVPNGHLIIVEGVGSTWHRLREAFTLTVWLHAPGPTRHTRACARLGHGDFAPHAAAWAAAEDRLFGPDAYPDPPWSSRPEVSSGFDVVVDTSGSAHGTVAR